MDALKTGEVKKMEMGGNRPWKDFFNEHASNKMSGRSFEDCTIGERYDSEAGEEWKERLTAKVEGVEYVPNTAAKAARPVAKKTPADSDSTPSGSGCNTPLSRVTSPPQRTASPSQKSRNEAYFARMGNANASRPEDLPPAQGGKYGGFGSAGPTATASGSSSSTVPSADDSQKDPVAALTKGFGWLSSTVTKQAANVNKSSIQPGVKSLQEGDLAAQAQRLGTQLGSTVQQGTKGLGEQFNKFVDPEAGASAGAAGGARSTGGGRGAPPEKNDFWDSFGQDPNGPPKGKKDFWDDFADASEVAAQQQQKKPASSIGTSAMKNTGGSGAGGKPEEGDAGWKDW
ncbi:hypothetical protein LTR85_001032 [Meristemomyces frigidus]|nr:hypothetical protein LTR85_001032 [Meristemomyces frigidus]